MRNEAEVHWKKPHTHREKLQIQLRKWELNLWPLWGSWAEPKRHRVSLKIVEIIILVCLIVLTQTYKCFLISPVNDSSKFRQMHDVGIYQGFLIQIWIVWPRWSCSLNNGTFMFCFFCPPAVKCAFWSLYFFHPPSQCCYTNGLKPLFRSLQRSLIIYWSYSLQLYTFCS